MTKSTIFIRLKVIRKIWLREIMGIMIFATTIHLQAQDNVQVMNSDVVPTVFLIGQNQESYSVLRQDFPQTLLEINDNNLASAYDTWIDVIQEMENFSEQIDYDLNGVKLWMQLYWTADGQIKHISYFLKPNSRTKSEESLKAFFNMFVEQYTMPQVALNNYNHYGSASFPVITE